MPRIWQVGTTGWADQSRLWATGTTGWGDQTRLWALAPSEYIMPAPPPGTTPTNPQPATPTYTIPEAAVYSSTHTMSATDTRDNSALPFETVTVATDADSAVWSLSATGPASLFTKLTTGDQPATLEVAFGGSVWAFVVDSVSRTRGFGETAVTVRGRSLTAAAGSPFQPEQNWVNDGATTGYQMASIANLYTGVSVVWEVEDWVIPDRVFSFSGTPLAVVSRVAEAIGAIVRSDRRLATLYVSPRYLTMPNQWPVLAPTVSVAFSAVESESYERADRPPYNGVYLSGQQSGQYAYVSVRGTNGAVLHPFVTDLLLTDPVALRQRGQSILGASGERANVTITLPVLTGAGLPGVCELGWTLKILDPAGEWFGVVRSVSASATHGGARQTLQLERRVSLLEGTAL